MKTKLTITIDEDLVPLARQFARARGMSLSQVVEDALRRLVVDERQSFSRRRRGKFQPARRDDPRYDALAKKYS